MGLLQNMQQQAMPAQQPQPNSEQMMYDKVMQNSLQGMAGAGEDIQERVASNPVEGLSDLVSGSMLANYQAARQNNKSIPPKVIMASAKSLAEMMISQSGLDKEQADDLLAETLYTAMGKFGKATQGVMPEQEAQQYQQMIAKVQELDNKLQGGMQ